MAASASRLARRRAQTERFDLEVALRPPAALRCRIAEGRRHVAFLLETIERPIQGADGQRAAGAGFDLEANGHTVGVVAQPQNGEEDDLLELTEVLAPGHMFCMVGLYGTVGVFTLGGHIDTSTYATNWERRSTPAVQLPADTRG